MTTETPQPPERTSYADRRKQRVDALAAASADEEGGVSLILSAWRRLRRNPVFLVGLAITVTFVVLAIVVAVAGALGSRGPAASRRHPAPDEPGPRSRAGSPARR